MKQNYFLMKQRHLETFKGIQLWHSFLYSDFRYFIFSPADPDPDPGILSFKKLPVTFFMKDLKAQ